MNRPAVHACPARVGLAFHDRADECAPGSGLLFGAYKYLRELTWVVGFLLFILTLAMGFSGQVMRFVQDAYGGLVTISHLICNIVTS